MGPLDASGSTFWTWTEVWGGGRREALPGDQVRDSSVGPASTYSQIVRCQIVDKKAPPVNPLDTVLKMLLANYWKIEGQGWILRTKKLRCECIQYIRGINAERFCCEPLGANPTLQLNLPQLSPILFVNWACLSIHYFRMVPNTLLKQHENRCSKGKGQGITWAIAFLLQPKEFRVANTKRGTKPKT